MQKNISPEEKLLSIIKGRHKRPDAEDAPTNKGNEPKSKTSRLKNKMDEYLSIALKNNFLKNNLFDPKVLRIFDKYMVIVLCLAFFYLIIDMLFANSSKKAEFIIYYPFFVFCLVLCLILLCLLAYLLFFYFMSFVLAV